MQPELSALFYTAIPTSRMFRDAKYTALGETILRESI
jgi:hypothetical protein